jgi:glyoxylase-like metal-dependent hydrolase (beta-lactamase superfamily II)
MPNTPVMTLGAVALHRVEELRIPNKIAYFTADAALLAANRHWLAPHFLDANDCFDLVFQSWVFEIDGRVVLVDPCTGNHRPHPVHYFNNLDVPFIDRLDETGFRSADIDFVVCTHLHHDHCGWNTQLRDGKWVPTFPNARYIMRQAEYDRWGPHRERYPRFDYNEGVFERSVQPVVEAGLADLVSGSHRLTPGLVAEPAPGHTPGHQMLHLVSSAQHALFTGDCFHHPLQLVEPSIPFGDSADMDQTIATRVRLVNLAADLGALLLAAHLPAPCAVRAWRDGNEMRFAAAGAPQLTLLE